MESDGKEKKGDEANPPTLENEVESRFLYQRKGPYELPAILQPKFSNSNVKKEKKQSNEKLAVKPSQEKVNLKMKSSQEKAALKLKSSNEKVDVKKKKSVEKISEKPVDDGPTPVEEDKTSGEKVSGEKTSGEKQSAENPQSAERHQQLQEQVKVDEGKLEKTPQASEKPIAEDTAPADPKTKTRKTEKREEKKKEKGCKTVEETDKVKMGKTPRRKKVEENVVSPAGLLPEITAKDASPNFLKQAASPVPPKASPMPLEQRTEKSKAPKSTALVKKVSRRNTHQQKDKDKKTIGFFRAVYAKTKFWSRKSDCVAEPTPAMLKKACVPGEYGVGNDFKPEFKKSMFTKDEIKARKKNAGYQPTTMFISRRPFWLIRQPTDTFPPKCKIQMHKQVKQAYQGNTALLKPRMAKREGFYHPIHDKAEKMKELDKTYGSDVQEVQKRVSSNTFYATLMFETEKLEAEKRKSRMMEREKTPTEFHAKKVTFREPPNSNKIVLSLYNRKDRANIDNKKRSRAFTKMESIHTQERGAHKKPLPACASNSSTELKK